MENHEENNPLISVIMGVYNCEATLAEALDCLLAQTETDWELIACDDGSTDGSFAVLERYAAGDPRRFRVLRNAENRGLNHTLNRCLGEARGRFIARMDGDDLCVPERFEKQLAVLADEAELAVVSSDMEYFDENGVWGRIAHPDYPTPEDFLHGTPFCHAPCMVRREAYEAVGGYSEDRKLLRVEDYHLWIKMYKAGFRGKNIHEALYLMRDDRDAYRRRTMQSRLNEAYVRCFAVRELGLPKYGYLFSLRPILVGLLPKTVYDRLHKARLQRAGQTKA